METRKVKYKDEWKTIGDEIVLKENLCWYIPIKVSRTYKIYYIGEDGGAAVIRKNSKMPLNTCEQRDRAYFKEHLKAINGDVEIEITNTISI